MFRKKLRAPTVDTCKFRSDVRQTDGAEVATCRLLKTLLGGRHDRWCHVSRHACDACCQSFPPSKKNINSVVASLVYQAAQKILAASPAGADLERIRGLAEAATQQLNVVHPDDYPPSVSKQGGSTLLTELVPQPAKRYGRRVRRWAVGVTTAPRRQPTLEVCLESLVRAGWERPHLFVDSAVRVPERFLDLPGTFRDEQLGAWPNYYLALVELLMRHPHADAYMILQDDVLLFDRENLRAYLEEVLWPASSTVLVSLYCSLADSRPESGWYRRRRGWVAGAHAFLFPPQLAKAFVTDQSVFAHRWASDPEWGRCVGDLIDNWTRDRRLDVWFTTPSLAQHIGDTSTLWPNARAVGGRRADRYAGDMD
jgi:hypothetical protein